MIIESPANQYRVISHMFHGTVNDAYVCVLVDGPSSRQYAVNVIHDRNIIKKTVSMMYSVSDNSDCFECFTWKEALCVVFNYYENRDLEKFIRLYMGNIPKCELVFTNLVIECMSGKIPAPILKLVLDQQHFNLMADLKITMGFCLDFSLIDASVTETDCLYACISYLLILFDRLEIYDTASYQVISKKYKRNAYHSFIELYKDLKSSSLLLEKNTWHRKITSFFKRNNVLLFSILKYTCLVLALVAVILIICQITIGDVPFFRIFTNTFKKIGYRELWK